MTDELEIPAFTIERDYAVSFEFDGNHVSVLVRHVDGRSAQQVIPLSEIASAVGQCCSRWVDR